jgi:hypothetical protein
MHVTLSHKKPIAQAIKTADSIVNEVFSGLSQLPMQVVNSRKSWVGPVMEFGLVAKLAFLSYPVHGTLEVTDSQFILNLELGLLGKLLSEAKAKESIEKRVRGLLS